MKHFAIRGLVYLFVFVSVVSGVMSFTVFSGSDNLKEIKLDTIKTSPPYIKFLYDKEVDSILNSLSTEEKIAQLMMLPVYPRHGLKAAQKVNDTINAYGIGGVILFKGTPHSVANTVNFLQKGKKLPLLTAIDGEWGVSMRVDSTVLFPKQMMLGAVRNEFLIYKMGQEIARECKLLGIHVNFAPVVDININPKNVIIGYRSFGENKINVATKGFYYYRGMQDNGVLAVAKHFPGHGDTEKDSHKTLPVITHDYKTIYETDLYPFRYLINTGVGAVMVAHLHIPALDSARNMASTLSPKVVKGLLYDTLEYEGIAFTDALNMKGVASYWDNVTINVKAFLAGNTVLLMPKDVGKTIRVLSRMVRNGEISKKDLDDRVRKIIALKKWLGLTEGKNVFAETDGNLVKRLVNDTVLALKQKLVNCAITLLKNDGRVLPVKDLAGKKVLLLNIAKDTLVPRKFNEFMNEYKLSDVVNVTYKDEFAKIDFGKYDYVFVSLYASGNRPRNNYGIPAATINRLNSLGAGKKTVFVLFGSPYLLDKIETKKYDAVVVAYETDTLVQMTVPQKIYGAYGFGGILPVSAGGYVSGTSITTKPVKRLKFGFPVDAGMNADTLSLIDEVVREGIEAKAFPGAQVLVARNGIVVYRKSFGYYTYDKRNKVTNETLYDIASVTKLASTALALMRLYEQGKFDLNDKLSKYLTFLDTTNKKDITFLEILTHQAGLTPWIPFYLHVLKDKAKFDTVFSKTYSERYAVKVCDSLYMDTAYIGHMYKEILDSPMHKKEYKYSDIGYYLFRLFIEKETGQPLDQYVEKNFYQPLGADRTLYNPLRRFDKAQIAPTEDDRYFRHTVVRGYVHDYGAAMLGGVGGHAGLFSTAGDLAKIMQMLLNGGEYGGIRYFKPATIKKFTSCPFCPDNRRGIGFDKPEKRKGKIGPTCDEASASSYGHTGFTGTMVWNDPANGIVFVFLSNRVYPDINNKKLLKLSTRTKIQHLIYSSITEESKTR